jgi:hypothetical protein
MTAATATRKGRVSFGEYSTADAGSTSENLTSTICAGLVQAVKPKASVVIPTRHR